MGRVEWDELGTLFSIGGWACLFFLCGAFVLQAVIKIIMVTSYAKASAKVGAFIYSIKK